MLYLFFSLYIYTIFAQIGYGFSQNYLVFMVHILAKIFFIDTGYLCFCLFIVYILFMDYEKAVYNFLFCEEITKSFCAYIFFSACIILLIFLFVYFITKLVSLDMVVVKR